MTDAAHIEITGPDVLLNLPIDEDQAPIDQQAELSIEPPKEEVVYAGAEQSKVQRALSVGRRALGRIAIAVEVNPLTNGPIRYGAFAATLKSTGNVPLSVGVLVGTTLLVEGGGALAMGDVLERDTSKTLKVLDKAVDKIVPKDKRVSPLAEAVITNYAGVPALMYAKKRENPSMKPEENRKHALKATGLLAGACAIQGVIISEGLTDPTNPKIMVPIVVGIAASVGVINWAKKKIKQE